MLIRMIRHRKPETPFINWEDHDKLNKKIKNYEN